MKRGLDMSIFHIRHEGRKYYREYLMSVLPIEAFELANSENGRAFADWLRENVFKHENTFLTIDCRGDEDWVYADIVLDTQLHRKRQVIEKLLRYGFRLITHDDVEAWQFVPIKSFIAKSKGRLLTSENSKRVLGSRTILKTRKWGKG